MGVKEKMEIISNAVRYRTGKTGLLNLTHIAQEIRNINEVVDPFFSKAEFADSVAEMTDKTKLYVLNSTGNLWMYQEGDNGVEVVTEQIVGTWESGRLSSSGTAQSASGFVITPYIDVVNDKNGNPFTVPFTLHLTGIEFSNDITSTSYNSYSYYDAAKTHKVRNVTSGSSFRTTFNTDKAELEYYDDASLAIKFTPPVTDKSGYAVGYFRFTGRGTAENANVYITYEKVSSSESGWIDTGIKSAYQQISERYDLEVANYLVGLFMNSAEYDNNDYSYTQVTNYAVSGDTRTDVPNKSFFSWNTIENAILYAVSVKSQTYYTTKNSITLSNFIPNTKYEYSVYALCTDGSIVVVMAGVIVTTGSTRMLDIDGIQNVRDIGGYTGFNSKKVRYGLIYRGSAMDEDSSTGLITEAGKYEMVNRLGIKTDIDLRYGKTESALGVDFINTKSGYEDYPEVITNATQRNNFKSLLESIVAQLLASKPIYIHCSGGCDRTGSLVFLLLGLLGVSESDLAKEYELSSFSTIGKGRTRNSTAYKYKEMVDALKAYSGATFHDKFVSFATDCGVTYDTIARFRNMMLG